MSIFHPSFFPNNIIFDTERSADKRIVKEFMETKPKLGMGTTIPEWLQFLEEDVNWKRVEERLIVVDSVSDFDYNAESRPLYSTTRTKSKPIKINEYQ